MNIIDKFLTAGLCLALISCGNSPKHHDHDHEGHEHEAIEAHEGHDHDAEDPHDHDAAHGEEAEHGHSGEIVLPPAKAEAAGVVCSEVVPGTFRDVILTGGDVVPAPGQERTLVANVPGIVSFTRPLAEGVYLASGEVVFTIASDALQEGDPVKRAKIEYEAAASEYARAQKLIADKIVSQKDFDRIKADYETAKMKYEAIAGAGQGNGAAVKTQSSGYLTECLVVSGEYVTVGQPLAKISGNGRLYLRAYVSERYASRLSKVAEANFRLQYSDRVYSTSELGGRLISYSRNTSEASPYIPVTFMMNASEDIFPGSFAEVWLKSAERENVITVPVSALTEEQGVHYVYVRLDEECYRKQPVVLGADDGQRVEIVSGLHPGETVVTQGAIHVKLASASNAIPAHSHNH